MNRNILKFVSVYVMSVTVILAQNSQNYWKEDVPVMDGVRDVSCERNVNFFTVKSSYKVKTGNVDEVYDFYSDFFKKIGWKNSFEMGVDSSIQNKRRWSSYVVRYNDQKLPQIEYSHMWESKNIPAYARLNLIVTDIDNDKLVSKVTVIFSPDVDMSAFMELNELISKDPQKLFILNRAVEGNPWEIDNVRHSPKKDYEHYEIVKQYYGVYNQILKSYENFGVKYFGVKSKIDESDSDEQAEMSRRRRKGSVTCCL